MIRRRKKGEEEYVCFDASSKSAIRSEVCVCACVCTLFPFILYVRLVDVPDGLTSEEGQPGFFIHLSSAVLAPIFLA